MMRNTPSRNTAHAAYAKPSQCVLCHTIVVSSRQALTVQQADRHGQATVCSCLFPAAREPAAEGWMCASKAYNMRMHAYVSAQWGMHDAWSTTPCMACATMQKASLRFSSRKCIVNIQKSKSKSDIPDRTASDNACFLMTARGSPKTPSFHALVRS